MSMKEVKAPLKRKALSYSIRFEVFKRDSFSCQYCGKSAPKIILHVDHMTPVAEGGTNEIFNLTTACMECNLGKGKRKLNDHQLLNKSFEQTKLLNEKREQLHMMMQWQKGLQSFEEEQLDLINENWVSLTHYKFNATGRKVIKSLLKKHSFDQVIEAMQTAVDQYVKYDQNEKEIQSTIEEAFNKIGVILRINEKSKENPYLRDILYIRGILRKRLDYVDERYVMSLLTNAAKINISIETLKEIARSENSWTSFRTSIEDLIKENNEKILLAENDTLSVKKLSPKTNFIGFASSLQTDLMETHDFSETKAEEISGILDTYCESFSNYLEIRKIKIDEENIVELIQKFIEGFIFEYDENTKKHYRNEIYRDLTKLNKFMYQTLEENIPFLYTGDRVEKLNFFTNNQYHSFCKAVYQIKNGDGKSYLDLIQSTNELSLLSIESAISVGIEAVLNEQFNRCKINVSLEQIRRLLRYHKNTIILDWLCIWLPVRDKDTYRMLHYEDPECNYSWSTFVDGLNLEGYGLNEKLLSVIGTELDYMKLFKGSVNQFKALIRRSDGILEIRKVKNWDDYLKQLTKSTI